MFLGYYTEPNGVGTLCHTSQGISAVQWATDSGGTLYAHWMPMTMPTKSVSIVGPSVVASGESAAYLCKATSYSGTIEIVQPAWSIKTGAAYATITANGILAAHNTDNERNVTIKATYNGISAEKTIKILPDGQENPDSPDNPDNPNIPGQKTQTVTFNPNGGTVDPTTKTYAIGSTYDPLPTPTLSGHWFVGWFSEPTDGMQVFATNLVSNAATRTLHAHWFDIPTLKITFYANGGTGSMPPTTVQFGSTVTLPANKFTKKNHAFSGWARSPQGNISWYDKGKVLVNSWGTLPLYAKWRQTGFTISFNANGGSCSTKATTRSLYEYSSDVLPWPTRKGYAFNGWWDKKSGNVYYVSYANFSDSQTVYAKWTKTAKKRYMNFYCNGGKYSGWSSFRKLYTTGRKFGALPVPTRKNHVFLGWYDTITGKTIKLQSSRIVPGEYATYLWNWQAKWAKSKYKVAFCANGGTGSMAVQTIKYGKATKLKANKFKRSGYTFQGWAKSKNGKVVFKNTKSVKNLVTDGKTVKLYAVWKKK